MFTRLIAAVVGAFGLAACGVAPAVSSTYYNAPQLAQLIRTLERGGATGVQGLFMTSNTVLVSYVRGGHVRVFQRTLPGRTPQPPDPYGPVNIRDPGPGIMPSQINTKVPGQLIAAIRRRLGAPGFLPDQVWLSSPARAWFVDGRAGGHRVSFFVSENGGHIQLAPILN